MVSTLVMPGMATKPFAVPCWCSLGVVSTVHCTRACIVRPPRTFNLRQPACLHHTCLQVRLLLLAALCGEHLLLLGPPGARRCHSLRGPVTSDHNFRCWAVCTELAVQAAIKQGSNQDSMICLLKLLVCECCLDDADAFCWICLQELRNRSCPVV